MIGPGLVEQRMLEDFQVFAGYRVLTVDQVGFSQPFEGAPAFSVIGQ